MTEQESIREMTAMLTDEGLLSAGVCKGCGETFQRASEDNPYCSLCLRVWKILSSCEIGGDG